MIRQQPAMDSGLYRPRSGKIEHKVYFYTDAMGIGSARFIKTPVNITIGSHKNIHR